MAKVSYEVTPHPGVSHVEYDGKLYDLDKLTPFELSFLAGKTQFIRKVPAPEPVEQAPVATAAPAAPPRPKRKRSTAA